MTSDSLDLPGMIGARGLPDAVAGIAVEGGAALHPVLGYRLQAVGDPAWTVISTSGRDGLVPLWSCGTTTAFADDDGTFLVWGAEEDAPQRTFPSFDGLVRSLLTDLYEDEEPEELRRTVAQALLPGDSPSRVAASLVPEDR